MKVLTHETGHMFGLAHCVHFSCVMNGSNHLQESDRRPLHLCPVCLRKLQFSVGFDVVNRYRDLARFDEQAGFADEARWLCEAPGQDPAGWPVRMTSQGADDVQKRAN